MSIEIVEIISGLSNLNLDILVRELVIFLFLGTQLKKNRYP